MSGGKSAEFDPLFAMPDDEMRDLKLSARARNYTRKADMHDTRVRLTLAPTSLVLNTCSEIDEIHVVPPSTSQSS